MKLKDNLAILIPVGGNIEPEHLELCLESTTINFDNVYVIFRNDNEKYKKIIDSFAPKLKKIIEVKEENIKKIAKIKIAISFIDENFVKILDPDDLFIPDKLNEIFVPDDVLFISHKMTMKNRDENQYNMIYDFVGAGPSSIFNKKIIDIWSTDDFLNYDGIFYEDKYRFLFGFLSYLKSNSLTQDDIFNHVIEKNLGFYFLNENSCSLQFLKHSNLYRVEILENLPKEEINIIFNELINERELIEKQKILPIKIKETIKKICWYKIIVDGERLYENKYEILKFLSNFLEVSIWDLYSLNKNAVKENLKLINDRDFKKRSEIFSRKREIEFQEEKNKWEF